MVQLCWTKPHYLDQYQLLTESVSGETSVWVTNLTVQFPAASVMTTGR